MAMTLPKSRASSQAVASVSRAATSNPRSSSPSSRIRYPAERRTSSAARITRSSLAVANHRVVSWRSAWLCDVHERACSGNACRACGKGHQGQSYNDRTPQEQVHAVHFRLIGRTARRAGPASPPAVPPRSISSLAGSFPGIFRPFRPVPANRQPAPRDRIWIPWPPYRCNSRKPRSPGPLANGGGRSPVRLQRPRRWLYGSGVCSGQPWRSRSPADRYGL